MNLQYRIDLLSRLGQYILSDDEQWMAAKEQASRHNGWFIPAFIDLAAANIATEFLDRSFLEKWTASYGIPADNTDPKSVGIVMAGNIPMVGFHDLLCVIVSGHRAVVKVSSKDDVLIPHLMAKLTEWEPALTEYLSTSELPKGCDAYIATGSNNSSRYFEYYFSKYPHIIRRNRTSVAVLEGTEKNENLEKLADDIFQYFGLGCRNVTKVYVPEGYDFVPLLAALKKYLYFFDHNKYRNNYDYLLAIHLLNNKYYMTNGMVLLIEDPALFSPISQLNYEFYTGDAASLAEQLSLHPEVQVVVGKKGIPLGETQCPALSAYPDRVDTLRFLLKLPANR